MSIVKYINKKLLYFVFTFCMVVLITITSSYAINNNSYKVITNDLSVSYGEEIITSISRINNIKIKNNSNERKQFTIYAKVSNDENTISKDKIYYSINDGYSSKLSNLTNDIIYSGYLNSNESIDVKVNTWIDKELLTTSDQGKNIIIEYDVQ